MLSEKGEEIVAADSPVSTRRPVGRQQTLFDPIDYGAWVYVQEAADFVCRVDCFRFGVCYRRRQIPYLYSVWGCKTAVVEFP